MGSLGDCVLGMPISPPPPPVIASSGAPHRFRATFQAGTSAALLRGSFLSVLDQKLHRAGNVWVSCLQLCLLSGTMSPFFSLRLVSSCIKHYRFPDNDPDHGHVGIKCTVVSGICVAPSQAELLLLPRARGSSSVKQGSNWS